MSNCGPPPRSLNELPLRRRGARYRFEPRTNQQSTCKELICGEWVTIAMEPFAFISRQRQY